MQKTVLEHALSAPLPGQRTARGPCPDELDTARFVDGTLGANDRARIVEHITHCDPCTERVAAMLVLLRQAEDQPQAGHAPERSPAIAPPEAPAMPASTRHPACSRRWFGPAMAAALVAVVAGGLFTFNPGLLPGRDDGFRELRSNGAAAAMPALLSPRDGSALPRRDLRLAWTPLEGSVAYEVELLGSTGDVLWQVQTVATVLAPPDSLYLEAGTPYYAWVRARLADGKTVKSPTVSFEILREH